VGGDGDTSVLCRRDGARVWCFDLEAVLSWEITLAAFEDHSELLTTTKDEWECRKTVIQRRA
jgi:hypothetical protein